MPDPEAFGKLRFFVSVILKRANKTSSILQHIEHIIADWSKDRNLHWACGIPDSLVSFEIKKRQIDTPPPIQLEDRRRVFQSSPLLTFPPNSDCSYTPIL